MLCMNIWMTVYKLRRAHFNKKLCHEAADAIENLAHDLDYNVEMYKDAQVELEGTQKTLQETREKLAKAEKYISDHFEAV